MPRKKTQEEFISDARKVHGDRYDYSLVDYRNDSIKTTIICKHHGPFLQRPNSHLQGIGCNKCGKVSLARHLSKGQDNFLREAKLIHGNTFDYSLVEYRNSRTMVKIGCVNHGWIFVQPKAHLRGAGCRLCWYEQMGSAQTKDVSDFLEKAKEVHGDKYDYSGAAYTDRRSKVKIKCPKHGGFLQSPQHHLSSKSGCPMCSASTGELAIIDFLEKQKIVFVHQKRFARCRYKNQLSFDFYIPSLKLLIEYDGRQHFKPIDYFGGEKGLKATQKRDRIKNEFAKRYKFKLLRIPYTDFDRIEEILSMHLESDTIYIGQQLTLFDYAGGACLPP